MSSPGPSHMCRQQKIAGKRKLAATAASTLLACLFLALAPDTRAEEAVSYRLVYDAAQPGRVIVTITLPPGAESGTLIMPRAIPMGYADVHYDRFVTGVTALNDKDEHIDLQPDTQGPRWQADELTRIRQVTYTVDVAAMEREILSAADTSKARSGYLGLIGYSVFAFMEGLESHAIELSVQVPNDWPVFLTLAPQEKPALAKASATAVDFYELADSQVAAGPDVVVETFDAAVPLYVAQYAETESDIRMLGTLAARSVNALAAYYGSVPFPHYTVHVEFLQPRSPRHQYGFSMEHMSSTTIFLGADSALTENNPASERRHLYNLAHHISHSWIPKRSAGKGYFPWSWEVSPVIDSIWFSEGWGQYAAAAALAGEGGLGEEYRHWLAKMRFGDWIERAPRFLSDLPLVEVSRIASTRYSEDFRTGRNVFSRGGMMAYEMDNRIRAATDQAKSLKDVLRRLFDEGSAAALDLDRIPQYCLQETGVDVSDIFERWMGPVTRDRPSTSP